MFARRELKRLRRRAPALRFAQLRLPPQLEQSLLAAFEALPTGHYNPLEHEVIA